VDHFWTSGQPDSAIRAMRKSLALMFGLLALFGIALACALLWGGALSISILLGLLLACCAAVYRYGINLQLAAAAERSEADQKFQLAAHAMENTMDGVMIVDDKKHIVAVNKGFVSITGYAAADVIGHTPRMLRSKHHTKEFYKDLWRTLRETGHWQGEIQDTRKGGEKYTQLLNLSAVRIAGQQVTHYVGAFNDVSQYKDYESALEFLANHDPLTNLPNRILLNNRLQEALDRAQERNTSVCVMFVDLDRFKVINDSLGHEVGDRVLQKVAKRLLSGIHPADVVARLGGDEFTIAIERLNGGTEEAALIAQRLLDALLNPMQIDGHQLYISASIGISFYPQDGKDANTLLKHADTAMYRAKEEGRDKFKFFSADMNSRAHEFMVMANSLRLALEKKQLAIEYQPRVDLASGRIVGVEALLRWHHPELGLISPERFIPLAEDTGLIVPIGEWVIRSACRQGKIWMDAGYPLQVAVNLSIRQFRKEGLVQFIADAVREAGYKTELLEVEITESLMMDDPESIKATLTALRDRGIKVALDDFGTGYSSLGYLKQFPLEYVKIDKSFVRDTPDDPDSVAIVKTIIAMAKNLRLSLIAEGIETERQRDLLCAEGCDAAQGFYFSRSVPADEILPLLAKFNGAPTRPAAAEDAAVAGQA
jgi:diguanylate cyclase (GGDEF)-like protein/PAS domain S-box-containing protein